MGGGGVDRREEEEYRNKESREGKEGKTAILSRYMTVLIPTKK